MRRDPFKTLQKRLAVLVVDMTEDEINFDQIRKLLTDYELDLLSQHNPNITGITAVTRADIRMGAKLLTVGHRAFTRAHEVEVAEVYVEKHIGEFIRTTEGVKHSLADMGVSPDRFGEWNENYATFKNDTETRRAVVDWLLARCSCQATDSAGKIVAAHPEDYPTRAAIRLGKLVPEFTE